MAERKKVKPLEDIGEVKVKKKSEVRKLADIFLKDDIEEVKKYVIRDVFLPSVKRAVSESLHTGIDMLFGGGAGLSNRSHDSYYKSYDDYYSSNHKTVSASKKRNYSNYGYTCNEIVFETRVDAERVLSDLRHIIAQTGMVTVGELYGMVRMQATYTDERYGWNNLDNASVVRVRYGFVIKLPRPMEVD